MTTNNSISKETLEQIEMALTRIVSSAMSIRHLVIPIEDSAAGANDIAVVSANCGAVEALANQIGFLADLCAARIEGKATPMLDAEYWFKTQLSSASELEGAQS